MKLVNTLRNIKKKFSSYSPSVEVLISRENLLHNLNAYKKSCRNRLLAPVLKSNAYGHGLVEIARILEKEDKAFFVIDSLYEAMVLRDKGIKSPLLIIGYTSPENINNCKLSDVSFTITSLDQLCLVSKLITNKKTIHLKIDTGMHRQGILPNQIDEATDIIRSSKLLHLDGVCSHLADADDTDQAFTQLQIRVWEEAIKDIKSNFPDIRYLHILATAGASQPENIINNVLRLGIGLYGIDLGTKDAIRLRPVLQMQSVISSVKTIQPKEYVGYGMTYRTTNETKIGTIPVGYFEGVNRKLSNQGLIKVRNIFCPIIGRVSMNITIIDVSNVPDVMLGDKVIVISNGKKDPNSIINIAKMCGVIQYEILVQIPQHLRRTII
jgi:alanine racemase